MIESREEYVGKLRSLAIMFAHGDIIEAAYLASVEELRAEWKEFKEDGAYIGEDEEEDEEEDSD